MANNVADVAPDDDKKNELDEYSYLETGGFSSERFKIEVKNLPKFYGISEFKKLLNFKLKLNPGKIKPPRLRSNWLYVCFHNDDDRDKAIKTLDGFEWKGSKMKAMNANPAPDPLIRKRKMDAAEQGSDAVKVPRQEGSKSQEERIKESTIPYWNTPYEKQIELKEKAMRHAIQKIGSELWKCHPDVRGYIEAMQKAHNGLICEFEAVKTSPLIEGYRNKCEFTVGMDKETMLPTVGFRVGKYVSGFTGVAPVDGLTHAPEVMKKVVKLFQEFVRASDLKVFSPEDHSGHWKQLMVRQSFSSGDLMLVIGINPQEMTEAELDTLKKSLITHFTSSIAKEYKIVALYFQRIAKRKGGEMFPKVEHLWGETHIEDTLLGLKFRISPEAFFQINTGGAEICYQAAIDMAKPTKDSTVVDICCGTGTIGLCFAKHCGQVLGLELIPEAVTDAKANATSNNIDNADFFVGKAEELLTAVVGRATNDDVIAIIDPPRAGLHVKAISRLRGLDKVSKLVFISCDPHAALKNFVDLGRATSKTMHGDPFFPTKAVAVDMFPYTKHTELLFLFERMSREKYLSYKKDA